MRVTDEMIEELRADEMTAEEILGTVLRRPEMFGLVSKERYDCLKAERDAALEAIERVRKLHVEDELHTGFCAECSEFGNDDYPMVALVPWPCRTIKALDGSESNE